MSDARSLRHICPCGNPVTVDGRLRTGFPFGPREARLAYHYGCAERLGVSRPRSHWSPDMLLAERETHARALDLLCSCAAQWLLTQDDGTLRHSCMSVEEELCEFLVAAGRLEQVGRGHYRWAEPGEPANWSPNRGHNCPQCHAPQHLPGLCGDCRTNPKLTRPARRRLGSNELLGRPNHGRRNDLPT